MPQPKSRISRSKRGMRRAHQSLERPSDSTCSNCNAITISHRVCPECGYYKGKEVIRKN
ncbi:MAG: 50S ribosomal protein L32 [Bdellovibrionales bacterium]